MHHNKKNTSDNEITLEEVNNQEDKIIQEEMKSPENTEVKNDDPPQEANEKVLEEKNEEVVKDKSKEKEEKNEVDAITEKLNKEDKELIIKKYIKLLQENKKIHQQFEQKEKESTEYLDKYRRALADMENLRKRMIAEKQDSLRYANFSIINDLLIILDDFQRAIDSGKNNKKMDINHFVNGIEMIDKQFNDLLFKKYGVLKYGEKGDEFDPKIHLAMMAEDGDFDKEIIIEIFAKGYMLHERVIRAAQVKIGKPKK